MVTSTKSAIADAVKSEVKATLAKGAEAPLPDVEITADDQKFVRQTYLSLFQKQVELNRATVAMGEVLYKMVHRAIERAKNDLAMARAYVEHWCAIGEKEMIARDLKARIDAGEVEKGSSETRTLVQISGTYVTYKSQMLAGLKLGIDPNEKLPLLEGETEETRLPKFSVASEYLKAVREKTKATRAPRQPKPLKLSTVETGLTPECNALIGRIIADVRTVALDEQNETFETVLQQFSTTIATMLSDYRVKHGGAKTGKVAVATTGDAEADANAAEAIAEENATEEEKHAKPAPKRSRR